MKNHDLLFLEQYEAKGRELMLLDIVKSSLTPTGRQTYDKIKKWLDDNLNRYLAIQSMK